MPGRNPARSHKPRELRRRVIAAARLRRDRGWSDATILNMSSRGLQIQTNWPLDEGSWVELRRGEHVIRAQVVWYKGVRAGLRSDELLPVDAIAATDPPTAFRAAASERRRHPRTADASRMRGRVLEFAGVISIALLLAAGILTDFQQAFAKPLATVAEVLR